MMCCCLKKLLSKSSTFEFNILINIQNIICINFEGKNVNLQALSHVFAQMQKGKFLNYVE